jgi:hypothetical protein
LDEYLRADFGGESEDGVFVVKLRLQLLSLVAHSGKRVFKGQDSSVYLRYIGSKI